MKRMLIVAGALACGLSAWADAPVCSWFTATPGNLGGGSWSPAPSGTNTSGTAYWEIETDDPGEDDALFTAPTIEENGMTTHVSSTLCFGTPYRNGSYPAPGDDVQAGVIVGLDGDGKTNYYGLVAADGTSNYAWTKLTGANPPEDLDTAVTVKVHVNYGASPVTVSYQVGETLLSDGTSTTLTRRSGSQTKISVVGYAGCGKVQTIAGNVDAAAAIGETPYLTFAQALANNSGTIKLYKDAAHTFSATGSCTVNANGFTFTPTFAAAGFQNTRTVSDGVQYTLRTGETFSGGSGTKAAPYAIASDLDLLELAHWTSQTNSVGKHYEQTKDIALTAAFDGIGTRDLKETLASDLQKYVDGAFQGYYDGADHTVSGLILETGDYVGFFNSTYNAGVRNLKLSLGNATGWSDAASGQVGAVFVGVSVKTAIENCQTVASGSYTTFQATKTAAGFVGYGAHGTVLSNCVNNLNITSAANEKSGGFVACAQAGKSEGSDGVVLDGVTQAANVSSTGKWASGLVGYADIAVTLKGTISVSGTIEGTGTQSLVGLNGGSVSVADDAVITVPVGYVAVNKKSDSKLDFATVSGTTATLPATPAIGGDYYVMNVGAGNITLAGAGSMNLYTNVCLYSGIVGVASMDLYDSFTAVPDDTQKRITYTTAYKQNTLDVDTGTASTGKIVVDNDYIAKIAPGADLSTEQGRVAATNALNAVGSNGQKVWESYAMSIDSDKKPTFAAVQDTDAENLTVSLAGVAAKAGSGATLKYTLDDGAEQDSPSFTIPLNTSGDAQKIRTIKVRVQPAETSVQ